MPEPWDTLALYESRDLVSSLFQSRHGRRSVSAEKAGELVSHFAQGRGYFSSAADADPLVRPLLLYYGVVALSRGLVLFLDPEARETSLSPAHGLTPIDWRETVSKGISAVADLTVRSTSGTFEERRQRTGNIDRAYIWCRAPGQLLPTRVMWTYTLPIGPAPSVFKLKELLSRIPELASTYERTFGAFTDALPATVTVSRDQDSTEYVIRESRLGLIREDALRSRLALPAATTMEEGEEPGPLFPGKFRRLSISHPDPERARKVLPHIKNDQDGNAYVITPLPDGSGLSTLQSLFAVSYILGMLVRYYPSTWMALLGRAEGDFLLPLLQEATALIAARFPTLVVGELEAERGEASGTAS